MNTPPAEFIWILSGLRAVVETENVLNAYAPTEWPIKFIANVWKINGWLADSE